MPNYCAWAKQDLVRITPTNSIYFSNPFTCFSITLEWTQCCPVNTVQCCSMRSAQLVQNSGLLLQPFPSLVDWPVDVVAFYFPWYVTCPPEWLQFLSSPNWMHRPPHQAGWGEIELWSAVPEIALMISSRRDQGLLEGYCTGGVDEGVGSSVRKWKEILNNDDQTFICLSSCTTDGDTHVSGKKDAPQDIFLSDERRRKGSPKIGSSVIIYFLSCLLKPVWLSLFCETQKEKLLL